MSEMMREEALETLLSEIGVMDEDDLDRFDVPAELAHIRRVETFAQAGVMTTDRGVVILADDGRQFQVTIVQGR